MKTKLAFLAGPGALAFLGGLSVLLLSPRDARCSEIPFWPQPIDTVHVVAARPFPEERIVRPHGFVQVVLLGSAVPASSDLGDLLDRVAGAQVRRFGGLGAISFASIRGSAPSQVEVRIDDVPISTAPDGTANLALLPARLFDRVEVGRGPLASSGAGSGAGVIRLVSPERLDLPLRVRAGIGSFGTRDLSATAGIERGGLALLLSGGRTTSRGDYPYLDRGSTPWEGSDDRAVRRANNDLRQDDLLVHARWRPRAGGGSDDRLRIDYMGQGLWKDAGVPGTESRQTANVRDRFRRIVQSLGAQGGAGADVSWKIGVRRQEDIDRFRNPDGEIGLGRADSRSRLLARGVSGGAGWLFRPGDSSARLEGSFTRETFSQVDRLENETEPDRRRDSRDLGAEVSTHPVGDRLEIFGSQRWTLARERGTSDLSLATPRLGAAVSAGRGLTLRAGWGRFGRMPSFVERFGRGGVQVGNPDLLPERGESWDCGAILRYPAPEDRAYRMQLEIVRFSTRTEEAIVWIQNSQRTTRPQNLEKTRVTGTEATLRLAVQPSGRDLRVTELASATIQDPRDDGPTTTYHGRLLPYLPKRKGSMETRVEIRALSLVHRIDHESPLYRDRYNSQDKRRGSRTLQDLEVGVSLDRGRFDLAGAVRNLADQRADDVEGFPLPGRSYSFEVTVHPEAGQNEEAR